MAVPNHQDVIESVLARFDAQNLADGIAIDAIGRRLLPHYIEAMPPNERPHWGVLEKRTSNPYNVPYDILVWLPTREHFDVQTSYPLSGDKQDTTGPRRLKARWASVGILPKKTWHGCDWRETQKPIVPLGDLAPPTVPPAPPVTADLDVLAREVAELKARVNRHLAP